MIGFSFKGIHSSSVGIGCSSVNRTIRPAVRTDEIVISGAHGSFGSTDDVIYENRQIAMKIYLVSDDWIGLRIKARDVAEWLSGSGKLIFDDEPDKFYMARINNAIDIEQIPLMSIGQTEIQFECLPFAYMLTEMYRDDSWDSADYPWLMSIPWDPGVMYSFPVTTNTNRVFTNPGTQALNYKCRDGSKNVIKVTGSWSTISFTMNGKSLQYSAAGSGVLIIDNINMEVTVNGANQLQNINGDLGSFLTIKPGDNTLSITGTGMNVGILIDFRPLWL